MSYKPPAQSKTIIFNLLAVLVLLAQYFGFQDFTLDPIVQALVIAIANFALRFVTTTSIMKAF